MCTVRSQLGGRYQLSRRPMRSLTAPGIVSHIVSTASGSRRPSSSIGGSSNRYHDDRSDVVGTYGSHGGWPLAGRPSMWSQKFMCTSPPSKPSGNGSRNDGHSSGGGTIGATASVNEKPSRGRPNTAMVV